MSENNQNIILYGNYRSSPSWRVRLALGLKKIEYKLVSIDLFKNEQKSEVYFKVNPNQRIPALIYGDQTLIESTAIIEFLEENFPQYPLLPEDRIKRAQIRGFCQVINSAIHPYQNSNLIGKIEKEGNMNKLEWIKFWVTKGLTAIEELLKKYHGKFCFGDDITMADIFLIPQVSAVVERFGFDLTPFPLILSVVNNLKDLPEFIAASPSNQPDYTEQKN
ncbi:maleylacetoacetate isomerase (macronuclear) [Tetrahymena thermophila SB210]|uniref:Maleylacetoacetate isomerase n=1 Tax=Tetrahymena thermophila (strain SB210) TaxID=312017 RepID=Q22V61_TETTS|nr:maleylacetoacetate isomerase [Tetrahymena thermophila SB210]EAR89087.1 maleylacetoacetate isomerase [Tetrahymena thermophila SB210]|eukprot:XP_001009332.1 maleylacetoacetate isomerase [Tetrahymena thermophila SB210]